MRATSQIEGVAGAIDELVQRMLENAGVHQPPVDALAVAWLLGIAVVHDQAQAPRGRHVRIAGTSTIFVRPEERPERLQWAVAHELGEALAHVPIERAQVDLEEAGPHAREQAANMLASRLLLPTCWFAAEAARCSGNLVALKQTFSTASHELIALRLLDLADPLVVTIFDHGRVTRRACNCAHRPPPLCAIERLCQSEAHRTGRVATREAQGVVVRGWPIHEPHWRREILLASAAEERACDVEATPTESAVANLAACG
jgi:hypothetical protein